MIVKCMLCKENRVSRMLKYDQYIVCISCRNRHQQGCVSMTIDHWKRIFIQYLRNEKLDS